MRNMFGPESPVMDVLRKIMYCLLLNMIFLVCCLPVFTLGPAVCALYYTIQKVLKNDRGYVFQSFFKCLKNNIKQTLPTGAVITVIFAVFQADSWILQEIADNGFAMGNAYIIFEVLKWILVIYAVWVFSYFARFENKTKMILKNASILMIRHLLTSILLLVLLVLGGFAMYLLPITICICPVVMMWFATALLEKVFYKYMSEEDKDLEMKRNMIYQ